MDDDSSTDQEALVEPPKSQIPENDDQKISASNLQTNEPQSPAT